MYDYVPNSNSWIDPFGLEIVDNIVRYKHDKVTPNASSRGTAINRACNAEQELINRTGKGTINWSPQEMDIIRNGRSGRAISSAMSQAGYTGHHINNVSDFPELKGDERNIVFLRNTNHPSSYDEHLYSNRGHRGNYDNKTKGRLIDRAKSH